MNRRADPKTYAKRAPPGIGSSSASRRSVSSPVLRSSQRKNRPCGIVVSGLARGGSLTRSPLPSPDHLFCGHQLAEILVPDHEPPILDLCLERVHTSGSRTT